jgi:hypothetical protein
MGNRVTVNIASREFESPINVYSHWNGSEIYPVVQGVLEMSDRIGDGSYLTASIVHAVFTQLGYDGKLGFGLWAAELEADRWDDNPTMFVDADTGMWRFDEESDWYDRSTRIDEIMGASF